ncbi:NAD(P)-dependent oxidoreductase [Listeria monocytogenes]|uniref:NAD-dependent epimerase/dehydratase family protein n=1 Tax=Listeria monocytogenes TaxID=1639 RepID=UPI000F0E05D9|nr:NAD(P)-dependent oxidoreductase [Listeria monocytogenes]EAG1697556.1 NAD(P)-dependent oxidoreductase [Listeria monocytogenes]ECB9829761.1 NAD(P)-dependent oxidoreductase [Listeria monocytogenes]EFQ5578426.1 NAD(P)-dependent oxidoreductase [Listeria monocytogenes]EHU6364306.1 NAD(P)-dependent oxidoreductase [Listeria monocytogenes]EHW3871722.1 NAD(P)-dependent oxidoreductase [Listeria monocytogenes]
MKIIVTGATGFLGSYLIRELLNCHYQVVAIGRNKDKLKKLENLGAQILQLNLTDVEMVYKLWPTDADIVIHAAALSTIYGPYNEFYKHNVEVTNTVLNVSKVTNIKRFIHVSSPSIYTTQQDRMDIKENEFDSNNCLNNYIRTKIQAEELLQKHHGTMELVIVRPRGLFGIGDTSIFPRLLKAHQTIGVPLFKRKKPIVIDITCVENVAYALRLCCETSNINGEIFNITNNEPMEFKMIIERIFKGLDKPPQFKIMNTKLIYPIAAILESFYRLFSIKSEPALTRYTVCTLAYSQTLNIRNAQEKLGYKPALSIFEGIDQYVHYIQQEDKQ